MTTDGKELCEPPYELPDRCTERDGVSLDSLLVRDWGLEGPAMSAECSDGDDVLDGGTPLISIVETDASGSWTP